MSVYVCVYKEREREGGGKRSSVCMSTSQLFCVILSRECNSHTYLLLPGYTSTYKARTMSVSPPICLFGRRVKCNVPKNCTASPPS